MIGGRITILVDDEAEHPYIPEHGFAALIEVSGKRILFDTGWGKALFHNAEISGISLSNLDGLVLSHGHYDHSGNLSKILSLNPGVSFFAHPGSMIPRWSLSPVKKPKSAGVSGKNRKAITGLSSSRLHWCKGPVEITTGVWITGEIERKNSFEDTGGNFYKNKIGTQRDFIVDDISIWIDGDSGLTIICGCCHSGLKNTLGQILASCDTPRINTLLGGFHLIHSKKERLEKTISFINRTGIERIIPSHCTGKAAVESFREHLDSEIISGSAGLQITI